MLPTINYNLRATTNSNTGPKMNDSLNIGIQRTLNYEDRIKFTSRQIELEAELVFHIFLIYFNKRDSKRAYI